MKDQNLLALVKRAVRGNKRAFVELCELKSKEVLYLCSQEMGNSQDGQDAAQEVFIRIQKNIGRLKAPEAFNVWLNRIIFTTCQNQKRDIMKHRSTLLDDLPSDALVFSGEEESIPQNMLETQERREWLLSLVEQLPEKYRRCVMLHYFQNLSYSEIARVTGASVNVVNHNMRMARKHLLLEISEAGGLDDRDGKKDVQAGALAAVAFAPAMGLLFQSALSTHVSALAASACLTAAGIGTAAAGGAALGGILSTGAAKAAAVVLASGLAVGGAGAAVYHYTSPSTPGTTVSQPVASPQDQQSSAGNALPQGPSPDGTVETGETGAPVPADAILSGRVYLDNETVLDQAAQNGLEGVTLKVVEAADGQTVAAETATDSEGRYQVQNLPPGEYKLWIALPQGAAATAQSPSSVKSSGWVKYGGKNTFTVEDEQSPLPDADIELDLPAIVAGRIRILENGAEVEYDEGLLPGVTMQLYDPDGALLHESAVTSEGHYLFRRAMVNRKGTYRLHLEVDEDAAAALNIDDADIELFPGQGIDEG